MTNSRRTRKRSRIETQSLTPLAGSAALGVPAAVPVQADSASSSSSSAATLALAAANAEQIMDGMLVPGTRKKYQGMLKVIKNFYNENNWDFELPLAWDQLKLFFGNYTKFDPTKEAPPGKKKLRPKAFATVRLYKSAIVFKYRVEKVTIDPILDQALEDFLEGYQRQVGIYKTMGILPTMEGKMHLSFAGYEAIAKQLIGHRNTNSMVFSWPYFLLQWNLMVRSESVAAAMLEHFSWKEDALVVAIPKHKSDQQAAKTYAKHVFANPLNPQVCPILALSLAIFSKPRLPFNESWPLFEGKDCDGRFATLFNDAVKAMDPGLMASVGIDKDQTGTHSTRKGAASYCSGLVSGPSTVQIYLRAGWSLGVQDRYLFAGSGGDQFTGRVLCGLPFDDERFATVAPHFIGGLGLGELDWSAVLLLYDNFPSGFKQALPFLLASLVFHYDWLKFKLTHTHTIFSSPCFQSGLIEQLKPRVHIGTGSCCSIKSTGIPPHVTILHNQRAHVAGLNEFREELIDRVGQLPNKVTDTILSKVSVPGAIPITRQDMNDCFENMIDKLRRELPAKSGQRQDAPVAMIEEPDPFTPFMWGGGFHRVPENWKFPPNLCIKSMWLFWHWGNHEHNIGPLRLLTKKDLSKSTNNQRTKVKKVMQQIDRLIVEQEPLNQSLTQTLSSLSMTDRSSKFDQAYVALIEQYRPDLTKGRDRNWCEWSVSTVYKLFLQKQGPTHGKRKRAQSEESS